MCVGVLSWDFGGREAAPRRVGVRVCRLGVCVCVCVGRREPARVASGGAGSRPCVCGEGPRVGDPRAAWSSRFEARVREPRR